MAKRSIILVIILILAGLGIFLYDRSSPEEIEDPLLRKIKERGELIVGTDATYPPMENMDEEGNIFGMDMDIAKEVAFDLEIEAEFRNVIWEEIFDTVREGEVDMIISAITITSERAKIMDFSDPYFNAGQVIVIRVDKKEIIKGVEDLQGRVLGTQIETTSEVAAKELTDPSLVKSYENSLLTGEGLLRGEIDAVILDYPAAVGMVSENKDFQIVGVPFTQEFYGIATQKGQKMLLSQINKTIRRLKTEGVLKALEEKWLGQ